MTSTIGKGTGDADGAQGIQPVGILDAFPFRGGGDNGIRTLIGNLVNDGADGVDFFLRQLMALQKPDGAVFSGGCLRGEFPVVHIVQQRS